MSCEVGGDGVLVVKGSPGGVFSKGGGGTPVCGVRTDGRFYLDLMLPSMNFVLIMI
jgi:hypothetical protein